MSEPHEMQPSMLAEWLARMSGSKVGSAVPAGAAQETNVLDTVSGFGRRAAGKYCHERSRWPAGLCQPSYLSLHGHNPRSVIGKTDFDLFPESVAHKYREDDLRVMREGIVLRGVEQHVLDNGEQRFIERIKQPIRDSSGQVIGLQVVFWDDTDRVQTEAALEQERALLDTLLSNIPDAIYFKDRDSKFLRMSRAHAKRFGLASPTDGIGKSDADFFSAVHAEQAFEDEREIMRTGVPIVGKLERETWPDRDDTWVSTTKMPLRDPAGEVYGTFGISRDVTELKRAEDLLERQAAQAQLLHKTTAMAAQSACFEEALQSCIDEVCAMTTWPVGHVYLPADDGRRLEPTGIWHLQDASKYQAFREVTERTTFEWGIGLPGRIWATGQPAWIVNVQQRRELSPRQPVRSHRSEGCFWLPDQYSRSIGCRAGVLC